VVTIWGWNFEPGIRVLFGGNEATLVNRIDGNHLEATTPPGPVGPVEVALENPGGGSTAVPDAFTYLEMPCPVTTSITDLLLAREGRISLNLDWAVLNDSCLALYRVFTLTDPFIDPVDPVFPVFPDDFQDITDQDQDMNIGGDPQFFHEMTPGRLVLYQIAGEGTDGSLGPR
jgi:hypothetical protein